MIDPDHRQRFAEQDAERQDAERKVREAAEHRARAEAQRLTQALRDLQAHVEKAAFELASVLPQGAKVRIELLAPGATSVVYERTAITVEQRQAEEIAVLRRELAELKSQLADTKK